MHFSGWVAAGGARRSLQPPASRLAPSCLRSCPRCCQVQQHGRRVEQQRHDEDEPPQHHLVGLADHSGKISDGPEVGLDGTALVIRLLKRRLLREGRRCGRPRPERPS